jgi:hypothetical protein
MFINHLHKSYDFSSFNWLKFALRGTSPALFEKDGGISVTLKLIFEFYIFVSAILARKKSLNELLLFVFDEVLLQIRRYIFLLARFVFARGSV